MVINSKGHGCTGSLTLKVMETVEEYLSPSNLFKYGGLRQAAVQHKKTC